MVTVFSVRFGSITLHAWEINAMDCWVSCDIHLFVLSTLFYTCAFAHSLLQIWWNEPLSWEISDSTFCTDARIGCGQKEIKFCHYNRCTTAKLFDTLFQSDVGNMRLSSWMIAAIKNSIVACQIYLLHSSQHLYHQIQTVRRTVLDPKVCGEISWITSPPNTSGLFVCLLYMLKSKMKIQCEKGNDICI